MTIRDGARGEEGNEEDTNMTLSFGERDVKMYIW